MFRFKTSISLALKTLKDQQKGKMGKVTEYSKKKEEEEDVECFGIYRVEALKSTGGSSLRRKRKSPAAGTCCPGCLGGIVPEWKPDRGFLD